MIVDAEVSYIGAGTDGKVRSSTVHPLAHSALQCLARWQVCNVECPPIDTKICREQSQLGVPVVGIAFSP